MNVLMPRPTNRSLPPGPATAPPVSTPTGGCTCGVASGNHLHQSWGSIHAAGRPEEGMFRKQPSVTGYPAPPPKAAAARILLMALRPYRGPERNALMRVQAVAVTFKHCAEIPSGHHLAEEPGPRAHWSSTEGYFYHTRGPPWPRHDHVVLKIFGRSGGRSRRPRIGWGPELNCLDGQNPRYRSRDICPLARPPRKRPSEAI